MERRRKTISICKKENKRVKKPFDNGFFHINVVDSLHS